MAVDGIDIGSGVNTADLYAGRTKSASEAVSGLHSEDIRISDEYRRQELRIRVSLR